MVNEHSFPADNEMLVVDMFFEMDMCFFLTIGIPE